MKKTTLKKAQEKLRICDVIVSECYFKRSSDESFFSLDISKTKTATFHNVTEIIQATANEDFLYIFKYEAGIRSIKNNVDPKDIKDEDICVEITVTFDVIYMANDKLDDDEVVAFTENNVGYNVWPYWREVVASCCARMGIPTLRIPFYKMSKKKPFIKGRQPLNK